MATGESSSSRTDVSLCVRVWYTLTVNPSRPPATFTMRLALLLLAVAAPSWTRAATPGRFGDAGTLAPSGGLVVSHADSGPGLTSVAVAPLIFYFVTNGLAVGGSVGFSYVKRSGIQAATAISVGPAIGYNIRVRDDISLFPNARYQYSRATSGPAAGVSQTDLLLQAPLLVHFGNFYVGVGPFLGVGSSFGLTTITGGWF